jgi:hypothetical protein
MSTNVIPFLHLTHKMRKMRKMRENAQYMDLGQTCLHLFYMGTGPVPPSPNIPPTLHPDSFDGITYSVLSKNLLILITETCKTFFITSCPFKWKGILMMKAPITNMGGHQLLWTMGELHKWKMRTMKSARDLFQSG